MDITALPTKWRAQARHPMRVNDPGAQAELKKCADQLELAWHQHAHDGEFEARCRFCAWEREHNDHYPEELLYEHRGSA